MPLDDGYCSICNHIFFWFVVYMINHNSRFCCICIRAVHLDKHAQFIGLALKASNLLLFLCKVSLSAGNGIGHENQPKVLTTLWLSYQIRIYRQASRAIRPLGVIILNISLGELAT